MKTYKIRWNEGTYDDESKVSYRQANNLLAIEPEFNKMIIDYDKTFHAVSMVSPWTKETRVTLQTRIFE